MSYFIIQSNNKERNWEGKAWSERLPCKIYLSFDEVVDALNAYWFTEYAEDFGVKVDNRKVIISPLSEKQKDKLLAAGNIRW